MNFLLLDVVNEIDIKDGINITFEYLGPGDARWDEGFSYYGSRRYQSGYFLGKIFINGIIAGMVCWGSDDRGNGLGVIKLKFSVNGRVIDHFQDDFNYERSSDDFRDTLLRIIYDSDLLSITKTIEVNGDNCGKFSFPSIHPEGELVFCTSADMTEFRDYLITLIKETGSRKKRV